MTAWRWILKARSFVAAAVLAGACLALAAPVSAGGEGMFLTEQDVVGVIGQIRAAHASEPAEWIETGVRQAARLWQKSDGDAGAFAKFCARSYVTGPQRDALFSRFEQKLELLAGHMDALVLGLRLEMDEARGPLAPVDELFARFDPGAHLSEDLFHTKLAFLALLHFPIHSLEDKLAHGEGWTRRQWAEARLAERFAHRVPAEVQQAVTEAYAAADSYIYNYNIHLDHVVGADGKPMFRKGLALISHWGLRDELKAQYAQKDGLARQEMIHTVMERIVRQQIPAAVINSGEQLWDPVANTVDGKPADREPDERFARWLAVFRAHRREDPYYPDMPSHVERRFARHREMPEAEVEKLLLALLESKASARVARLVEKRLGRKLRPFDIWYDGFKARIQMDERELDRIVAKRYPDVGAFERAIPEILGKLGFDADTARFLAERIEVDPARGAGHAWGPRMRTEKAHLRTRVPAGGMDYKGFNIAMHELGHNVEQVFSLYRVDSTLLEGVPNNAFTEGFAFVFQGRDLDVLGLGGEGGVKRKALKALDTFWAAREIAGVALVDMRAWRWMQAHPDAKPAELRCAVVKIATEVWNAHYADLFGLRDSPLLAIYSHMINSGLYLPDYPMGHIIAFQVEAYLETHPLAKEMERMCRLGNLTPHAWMKQAVGDPVSAQPLIDAAAEALAAVE
ncbi:MAG: hypothetical protein JXR96_02760 [Deltaproteobacteria bacterium]|nr:hypothetical protein [Deltaproteobacteria bacterium]